MALVRQVNPQAHPLSETTPLRAAKPNHHMAPATLDREKSDKKIAAMKLEDFKNDYYWYSGKASDIARHLAFAGIAIIWIFRVSTATHVSIPSCLLLPLLLFGLTLAADLLQYVTATFIWGVFHQYHEQKEPDDPSHNPDLFAPLYLRIPITFFFVMKLVLVLAGFIALLKYMLSELIVFA